MATRPPQTVAPADDQALQDELNHRADQFSKEFASAGYEMGQAQNFIRELCAVYGLSGISGATQTRGGT